MKRSLVAVAAVLALGSASVYADPGFPQPSFKDSTDLPPTPITGTQTRDMKFPKSSMNGGGGPTGPATVVVQRNHRAAGQYANANTGTRTDAQGGAEESPTLNDTFNYPAY
jgi:hypothetical protein